MYVSREALLVAGIVGFYLVDTARLLYRDEALFASHGRGYRDVPGSGVTLARRYLVWPGLLRPDQALVQLPWSVPPSEGVDPAGWQAVQSTVRWLRWPACLMALLLLAAVPAALYWRLPALHMLWLLGAVYLTSLAGVTLLCWRRRTLGLNLRQCLGIGIDVVACPPFCINLVRRLTLRLPPMMSGEAFAQAHLPAGEAARCQALHARRAGGDGLLDPPREDAA